MANIVGNTGLSVGLDKDTKFINHLNNHPIKIVKGTAENLNLDDKFDLIHIRYVLIHNQKPSNIIERITPHLKTGGRLIIEEPDFTAAKWIDQKYRTPANKVNNAICHMFKNLSLNPAYGAEIIFDVEKHGLFIEKTGTNLHYEKGQSDIAKVMAQSAEALKDKYIATGKATPSDILKYINGANDPESSAIYYSTTYIVAKKI